MCILWLPVRKIDENAYGGFDPELESKVVPDPFYYEEASYVTIPRKFLAQFLRNCSARRFQVLLDLHAFPSGSSQGTYNGIYPLKPVFWKENARVGDKNVALKDVGLWIVEKLIDWVEGLDVEARAAVGGITVMNEPGHMLSKELDSKEVLSWIAQASNTFRISRLPSRGVKLYVNLIQSAIPNFYHVVPTWWESTFSEAERNLWAVMDIHNYLAWNGNCQGHPPEVAGGGYSCTDPIERIRDVLKNCLEGFAKDFAANIRGLKSITEFSLSTHSVAALACKDPRVLDEFMDQQAYLFRRYQIEPFFWTYKMPYGPNFEAGWSYQYHVGLAKSPPLPCHPPETSGH